MTANYIGARVPICDDRFIVNPIWYRLFSQLFDISGAGSVDDADASSIAPATDAYTTSILASLQQQVSADVAPVPVIMYQVSDNISPVSQDFSVKFDDTAPAFALLQSEIADLRAQLDDLRKGLSA